MQWNKERKVYLFLEEELTSGPRKNVNKLLQFEQLCKIINTFSIKETEYGHILKGFYRCPSFKSAKRELRKVIKKCIELNIPYTDSIINNSIEDESSWIWSIQIHNSQENMDSYVKQHGNKNSLQAKEEGDE